MPDQPDTCAARGGQAGRAEAGRISVIVGCLATKVGMLATKVGRLAT